MKSERCGRAGPSFVAGVGRDESTNVDVNIPVGNGADNGAAVVEVETIVVVVGAIVLVVGAVDVVADTVVADTVVAGIVVAGIVDADCGAVVLLADLELLPHDAATKVTTTTAATPRQNLAAFISITPRSDRPRPTFYHHHSPCHGDGITVSPQVGRKPA